MPTAGKLNKRIAIERSVTTKNECNEPIETWHPLSAVWVQVISVQASKIEVGGADMTAHRLSILMRYRKDLHMNDSLLYQGKRYTIDELDNVDGADREIILGAVNYES